MRPEGLPEELWKMLGGNGVKLVSKVYQFNEWEQNARYVKEEQFIITQIKNTLS